MAEAGLRPHRVLVALSRYTVDEGEEPELPPVQLTLFIHKLTMSAEFTKKAQVRLLLNGAEHARATHAAVILHEGFDYSLLPYPVFVHACVWRRCGCAVRRTFILKFLATSIGFMLPLDLRRCIHSCLAEYQGACWRVLVLECKVC